MIIPGLGRTVMVEHMHSTYQWTDDDLDAMFSVFGRYFIMFQWIESKLDQILLLGWGQENMAAGGERLACMRNADKVDAVRELVFRSPDFSRVHSRPEWCREFEKTIQRLHDERRRRNELRILSTCLTSWR